MSVGRPRWTSPSTCSIACKTWDARATSASPDPDGVGGNATAALIRAPRWRTGEPVTFQAPLVETKVTGWVREGCPANAGEHYVDLDTSNLLEVTLTYHTEWAQCGFNFTRSVSHS